MADHLPPLVGGFAWKMKIRDEFTLVFGKCCSSWIQTVSSIEFAVDRQLFCARTTCWHWDIALDAWREITTWGVRWVFCEHHNQVVPRLALAQLHQVLCPHFAVYELPRLCLGDAQHPKTAANKMRTIKTKQKMTITRSPPRAQSLVASNVCRSSWTEDASCSSDMLASTLLGTDNNRVKCWILSMPSATAPKPVQVCRVSVPAGIPLQKASHRNGSINQRNPAETGLTIRSIEM